MFRCLFCNYVSEPVYIVYKLKQKDIDIVIETTTTKKVKKRLKYLRSCKYVYDNITYDKYQDKALAKFYESSC